MKTRIQKRTVYSTSAVVKQTEINGEPKTLLICSREDQLSKIKGNSLLFDLETNTIISFDEENAVEIDIDNYRTVLALEEDIDELTQSVLYEGLVVDIEIDKPCQFCQSTEDDCSTAMEFTNCEQIGTIRPKIIAGYVRILF